MAAPEAAVRLAGRTYRFDLYEVRFPSPAPGAFAANNTVWARLYRPRRRNPPGVVMLPVMAAPNLWIEHRFLYPLVLAGYAVLLVELPFQFHRAPDPTIPSGQVFLARTARALRANFTQAVLDARAAAAWLRASGLVDSRRVGLFGISLGALVGSAALSVDPALDGGVLLLGGADFAGLVMRGEMTRDFVERAGIRPEEVRAAWRGLDPLDYRESNRGKKVELINVREDRVIPAENAARLHDAFPGSRQLWLPLGHYSAILHLLWLPSYVPRVVGRVLGAP